ncbi:hypothetical protein AVEN_125847-1 [Araneus ventricosus]|uniref:Uncharacterized protein n=1 Tax=Araneus ventricosus TaxID=182803 RepID=A0A4Y2WIT8_ARAVE|nr:hypothetical protein AVEN_125847-1 [Araneus ventricosus]
MGRPQILTGTIFPFSLDSQALAKLSQVIYGNSVYPGRGPQPTEPFSFSLDSQALAKLLSPVILSTGKYTILGKRPPNLLEPHFPYFLSDLQVLG